MYFDPSEFDFTSLTDVVGFDSEEQAKQVSNTRSTKPVIHDDASDLFDYSGIDYDEDEDYEVDPNEDINDILSGQRDTREAFNALDILENTDDHHPINFGDFVATKEELRNYKKDKEILNRDKEYFSGVAGATDQNIRAINERRFMHSTVLENNIKILEQRLQRKDITAEEYQRTDQELKNNYNAQAMLMNDVNASIQAVKENEDRYNANRIREADYILTQENPHWMQHKSHIINHLSDMGFTDAMIQKFGGVPLFKLATDSYIHNMGKKKIQEQVKNTSAVNARSTVGAKTSTRNAKSEQDAAKVKSAVARMGSSRQANVDAFKYLKD